MRGKDCLLSADQRQLAKLVSSLLAAGEGTEADRVCSDLVSYWSSYSSVELGLQDGDLFDKSGLIISPQSAANCALGSLRTRRYLTAVHRVVMDLLEQKVAKQPVRVLYPGCGPYGILALPLLALFSSDQLRIDVVDFHEASIESLRQITNAFGFEKRVQFTVGDALDYQIQADNIPDVIVSELMLAGLAEEGHVAINEYLLRQAPNALLIPERIDLSLCFAEPTEEFRLKAAGDHRILVGRAFSMDRGSLLMAEQGAESLRGDIVKLPMGLNKHHQSLLFTDIQLYKDIVISEYENGLTIPVVFPLPKEAEESGCLSFTYRKGSHPSLLCHVI